MLPILLAFAAGMLLAHVVRQLLVHHAQDGARRGAPRRPRARDAWLLPQDEDMLRRSRELARRLAPADGTPGDTRDGLTPSPHTRRTRESATASPRRGFGVTFRVRR